MRLLDINTNYSDSGGGIRTYHQAKTAWFDGNQRHRYYLVVPGPRTSVRRIGPRAVRIEVYGKSIGCGYRMMADYWRVWRLLRRIRPHVVEVGDPFPSALALLILRWLGQVPGWLTSFYHSDPIETWVMLWSRRPGAGRWRTWARHIAQWGFYRLQQRHFDVTVVTSQTMERHLAARAVPNIVRRPLGTDPVFFQGPPRRAPRPGQPLRLLFVGRLVHDKAADLLLAAMPRILALPGVEVSIVGNGLFERQFAALDFPNLHRLGYVGGRPQMAELYRQHDILLAPGPYETFGLAVLEAMASGLVVVGPDRGGTAELLAASHSPNVFRAGDLDDFVRVVSQAVAQPLAAQSAASRSAAQACGTWEQAIGRLIAYYEDVCGEEPSQLRFRARRSSPAAAAQRRAA